jgi:hypothetical protein
MGTALVVLVPPLLSSTSALSVCGPRAAEDQVSVYTGVRSSPSNTPSPRKRTRATVPSLSLAETVMGIDTLPVAGLTKIAPGGGLTMLPLGSVLVTTSTERCRRADRAVAAAVRARGQRVAAQRTAFQLNVYGEVRSEPSKLEPA